MNMSRSRLILIISIATLLIGGSIALWAAVSNNDNDTKAVSSDVSTKSLSATSQTVVVPAEIATKDVKVPLSEFSDKPHKVAKKAVSTAEKVSNDIEKDDEADGEKGDKGDKEVALADVPDDVIKTAKTAVPGAEIKKVEMENEDGKTIYCVKTTAKDEIKVSTDGKLIKIEKDDGEKDNEGHEKDNEKDDDKD
jgi:membrane-bound lytic murein transglycosylase